MKTRKKVINGYMSDLLYTDIYWGNNSAKNKKCLNIPPIVKTTTTIKDYPVFPVKITIEEIKK